MKSGELREAVRRLRAAVRPAEAGGLSDGELLRRWVEGRDEAAFEVLVWRHGPMVLGVCRRLLRDSPEAEDAFQATWLALVRRARSLRKHEAVGSWLYQVAYRVALRARATAEKRRIRSLHAGDEVATPGPDPAWGDLCVLLDEEVSRLPEKYRAAVVLCYFGGRTNEEAARELGRPVGTIVSRLVRARQRLRVRLTRRGVTLAAGAIAAALTRKGASAAVPLSQISAAVRAAALAAAGKSLAGAVSMEAAVLAQGVIRTMLMTKIKVGLVVALGAALLGGSGMFSYGTRAGQPPAPVRTENRTARSEVKVLAGPSEEKDKLEQLHEQIEQQRRQLEEREKQIHQLQERAEMLANLLKAQQARVEQADERWRKVKELGPSAPPTSTTGRPEDSQSRFWEREHEERVQQAREEVELLEAQLVAREAQIKAGHIRLDHARKRLDSGLQGVERLKAEEALAGLEAELMVRTAELKEPQVRLAHARRRLAALQGSPQAPQDPRHSPKAQRPQDLQQRLDALAKELEALRRELHR